MIDVDKEKTESTTLPSEKIHGTLEKPKANNFSQTVIQNATATDHHNHTLPDTNEMCMKNTLNEIQQPEMIKSSKGKLIIIHFCNHYSIDFSNFRK